LPEPFATVEQFLGRFDERFVAQLTSANGTAVDTVRVSSALTDATAELQGYLARIPAGRHPDAATLRVHAIKVATYLLSQGRPGKEFESIRNGYTDTIAFYKDILAEVSAQNATPPLGVSYDAPPSTFNRRNLRGLVP